MILKIETNENEKILNLLNEKNIKFEVLALSDYLNPYDFLTDAIMEERNIDKEKRHELFHKIVDVTDEIGYEYEDKNACE